LVGGGEPKVVVLVTSFEDPPVLRDTLHSLLKTDYENYEVIVVDCLSRSVRDLVEEIKRNSKVPIYYCSVSDNLGVASQLNYGLRLAVSFKNDAEYIARIEDDVILIDRLWLQKLVHVMEMHRDIQVAMPVSVTRSGKYAYCGGYLFGNGTICSFDLYVNNHHSSSKTYRCLCGGGHCYIVRKSYITELFASGIQPYCHFFFISSDDIDFALKVWLRGYKAVATTLTSVFHEGTTGPKRAPYRVYHMYKNRLCLLLMNFELEHILSNIWYRVLQDVASALIRSEAVLMFRAYLWVFKNFKFVLGHRRLRKLSWKRISDKELKRAVLLKIPMPIGR